MVLYCFCPNIISQGWSWLENKITESNEKIAETIYTPFHNGHVYLFWPCAATCGKQFSEENSCNQITNCTKIIPESGEIILLEEINVDFEYLTLSLKRLYLFGGTRTIRWNSVTNLLLYYMVLNVLSSWIWLKYLTLDM